MAFFQGGQSAEFHENNRQAEVTKLVKSQPKAPKTGEPYVDAFRQKVLEHGGRNGFRSLNRLMARMDKDGNKKLSKEELAEALADYGLGVKPHEVDRVFKYLDVNNDLSISAKEFVRGMRPEMPAVRRDLVLQAYSLLDANADDTVTIADLCKLYDASRVPQVLSGEIAEEEAMQLFAKDWDADGDNTITQAEFLDYYHDISATIDNNQYFELMIRNAWHISGGSGAAQNTTCRRVLVMYNDGRQVVVEIKNDLGIGPNDKDKMMKKLEEQGVTDIKEIQLTG